MIDLNIPLVSGERLCIPLCTSDRLFIVGANGSGKSALIQYLVKTNQGEKIRRISAHRQTWLQSGSIDLTPRRRKQFGQDSSHREMEDQSRWQDSDPQRRLSAVLFDLVAKENARARRITRHVDSGNTKKARKTAAKSKSAFDQLNELLGTGALLVTLENSNDEEILARHRDGSAQYSIAEMSDGERNAAILAATVLTVDPGTLLLIDEPERHLHRSIIEPFLAALFEQRKDCPFVVSTHEVALPAANLEANCLVVRSCRWNEESATEWDLEILKPNVDLPEDLKRAIFGSRKRILFVEGESNSLDQSLYSALFPDVLVEPKGNFTDVQKAVSGLRESRNHHNVEAFGLIDHDDREEEEVESLAKRGVFALDVHSVESLYYCSESISAVAHRQAESLGRNVDELVLLANQKAICALTHDDLAERMASRRCEGRVRNEVSRQMPNWKCIGTTQKIEISVESHYGEELARVKDLLQKKNWMNSWLDTNCARAVLLMRLQRHLSSRAGKPTSRCWSRKFETTMIWLDALKNESDPYLTNSAAILRNPQDPRHSAERASSLGLGWLRQESAQPT